MPAKNTFPKRERLTSRTHFDRIFALRCSVHDRRIVVFGFRNDLEFTRVGFGVSKKFGSAVTRNRFRRIYREAFRLVKRELPVGLDLMILPRSPLEPKLLEIQESLRTLTPLLAKKLAGLTMPPPNPRSPKR